MAIATLGVLAHRFWPRSTEATGVTRRLTVAEVAQANQGGRRLGDSAAMVTITVFTDYQCPYCKSADDVVQRLVTNRGQQLSVIVRNLPLSSIHPKAYLAASAADCAGEQGRFTAVHTALFALQPRLPDADTAWFLGLADSLGVPDSDAFRQCLGSVSSVARIQRDSGVAGSLGAAGTPAFVIDDRLILGAPEEADLGRLVDRLSSVAER